MADYRKTRDYQPDSPLELQYLNDPRYTPLDRIGGPGLGGAGNDAFMTHPLAAGLEDRAGAVQDLGQQRSALEDQLFERLKQPSYRMMNAGEIWDGLKQAGSAVGSALGRGIDAITPTQQGWDNMAMRLQNANAVVNGGTPLWMMQQQAQAQMMQNEQLMGMKRQQLAQQLQGQQETKRHNDLQLLEKAMASPRASALLEQLGQDPNYSMAKQAAMLHKGLKDADYGSFQAYLEFIPEDVQKRFMEGSLPQHEMTAWLDEARTEAKESAKVNAKNAVISRAMNKPAESRTPYEQQLVEEHQAKLEVERMKPKKAEAEIKEKESQAFMEEEHGKLYKWQRETGGANTQDMGNDRESAARRLFGKRYVELNPQQMLAADNAAADYVGKTQGIKSTAVQKAQLEVPDKLTPAEREKSSEAISTISLLDRLGEKFSEDYVGPVRGRVGSMMETFGGITDDEAEFRASVSTLKNKVVKLVTGAQMSEPEAQRILKEVPEENNPPEVFKARLQMTRKNIMNLEKARRAVQEGTGADTSTLPPIGKAKKQQSTKPTQPQGLPQVKTPADWEQLAPGTEYIDPNGKRKRKR